MQSYEWIEAISYWTGTPPTEGDLYLAERLCAEMIENNEHLVTTDCLYVSNSICGQDTPCPHFLKGVDRGIRLQGELLPQPNGIGSNARDKQWEPTNTRYLTVKN